MACLGREEGNASKLYIRMMTAYFGCPLRKSGRIVCVPFIGPFKSLYLTVVNYVVPKEVLDIEFPNIAFWPTPLAGANLASSWSGSSNYMLYHRLDSDFHKFWPWNPNFLLLDFSHMFYHTWCNAEHVINISSKVKSFVNRNLLHRLI